MTSGAPDARRSRAVARERPEPEVPRRRRTPQPEVPSRRRPAEAEVVRREVPPESTERRAPEPDTGPGVGTRPGGAGRPAGSRAFLRRALSTPGAAGRAVLLGDVLGPPVSLRADPPGPVR